VTKRSISELLDEWEAIRDRATSKEEFQREWSKVIDNSGWTRHDFWNAVDARTWERYFA